MTTRRKRILSGVVVLALLLAVAGAMAYGSSLPNSPDDPEIAEEKSDDLVVVVHGMGRTELSMLSLTWTLERQGYEVMNWGYSSTCCSVEELGDELAADLRARPTANVDQIHFVGHSLGNIIIRHLLDTEPPAHPGRVVMLAPPNDGAESADRYVEMAGWLLEPLEDLTTDPDSTVKTLPPISDRDVGIIAGRYDGKVAVDETRHHPASGHEVVSSAHTFIMNRPDVHHLTVQFLESGQF